MEPHSSCGMSGEAVSLEQVLKQASSRAEEIRIEIAALKERVGGGNPTSTVTVPQLLKGDAIPDVTEPEGKPDDPEGMLPYSAVVPSGERQAPPKTEDGTDTEDQQGGQVLRRFLLGAPTASNQAAYASEFHSTSSTPGTAEEFGGRSSDANLIAPTSLQAVACENSSWQEVYSDVLQKLHQSRSFRQLTASGNIAAVLRNMGISSKSNSIRKRLMRTPFAGDTCQAAAIAAGAITSECYEGSCASAHNMTCVIQPSPMHVVMAPGATSDTDAWQEERRITGGNSSGGGKRLPLVMPASAADLPVQAVLEELDQLLAWQASRSPGVQHQLKPGVNVTAQEQKKSTAECLQVADAAADEQQLDAEADPVSKWLQSLHHQRISLSRSNSSGCLMSEAGCNRSARSSECSVQRTMRRSNSMPSAQQQVSNAAAAEPRAGDLEHGSKSGSTSLKDDIIAQLKLAAAFRPWSRKKPQGLTAEAPTVVPVVPAPVTTVESTMQHTDGLVDSARVSQHSNSLAAAVAADEGGSNSCIQEESPQHIETNAAAAAAMYSPPVSLPSINTRRSSTTAAAAAATPVVAATLSATSAMQPVPAIRSPRTPSRSALLYQKLLQEHTRSSMSGSPKAAAAKRLSATSGVTHQLSGDFETCADTKTAQGHMPTTTGTVQHCHGADHSVHALGGQSGTTCSACGSPVVTKATPFSAGTHNSCMTEGANDEEEQGTATQSDGTNSTPATDVACASISLGCLLDRDGLYRPSAGAHTNRNSSASPSSVKGASSRAVGSTVSSPRSSSAGQKQHAGAAVANTSPPASLQAGPVHSTSPRKTGYVSSAHSAVSRVKAAAAGRAGSGAGRRSSVATTGSSIAEATGSAAGEAAMVTTISCGQLLQEAALQQAFMRVSEIENADSTCNTDLPHSYRASATVEESNISLGALVNDETTAVESGRRSSAADQHESGSRSISTHNTTAGGSRSSGVFVYRLQPVNDKAGQSSATAAAGAAALQTLSAAANRRGMSASPDKRSCLQRASASSRSSRSTSAGPPSRASLSPGVSRSSSARTRASTSSSASGGSQRIWRPGGSTSARDDSRKLQAYQSARKALMGSGGDTCSKRATAPNGPSNGRASSVVDKRMASPPVVERDESIKAARKQAAENKKVDAETTTDAPVTEVTGEGAMICQQASPPAVAEQGVQANMMVGSGLERASSLLNALKHKSQPTDRHSSPGRMQRLKLSAAPEPAAVSPAIQAVLKGADEPPGPSSPTTSQVEEAIKAAQVALLQRRWQLAQLRRAMQQHSSSPADTACSTVMSTTNSSPPSVASGCRITAGSRTAVNVSRQPQQHQGADSLTCPVQPTVNSAPCADVHKTPTSDGGIGLVVNWDSSASPQAAAKWAVQRSSKSGQEAAEAVPSAESQPTVSCFATPQVQNLMGAETEHVSMSNGSLHTVRSSTRHSRSLDSSPVRRHSSAAGSLAAEASAAGNLTIRSAASVSVPLPAWSAPRRVSSSGLTGEELMQYYRRSSAAETAEAAAIAEAEGAAEGSSVAGAMNLDAMLRAYNALSRRRSSADKSAALDALMHNMIAVAGVQAARQESSSMKPSMAGVPENSTDMLNDDDVESPLCSNGGSSSLGSAACNSELSAAAVAAAAEGSGLVIVRKANPDKAVSLKDTVTGKAVLAGVGSANITVQQAVHCLKVGLTRMPTATSGGDVHSEQQQQHQSAGPQGGLPAEHCAIFAARTASPSKVRPHSRPCSPFHCFGPGEALSDDEDELAGEHQRQPLPHDQQSTVQQKHNQEQSQDGVQFAMDEGQLVLVVPKHLALSGTADTADACRYTVTGVSLLCDKGAESSGSRSLELLTCAGRHRVELATERDWAGLLAGLNAMLLLREAQSSGTVNKVALEGVPLSDLAWSSAVEGVEV